MFPAFSGLIAGRTGLHISIDSITSIATHGSESRVDCGFVCVTVLEPRLLSRRTALSGECDPPEAPSPLGPCLGNAHTAYSAPSGMEDHSAALATHAQTSTHQHAHARNRRRALLALYADWLRTLLGGRNTATPQRSCNCVVWVRSLRARFAWQLQQGNCLPALLPGHRPCACGAVEAAHHRDHQRYGTAPRRLESLIPLHTVRALPFWPDLIIRLIVQQSMRGRCSCRLVILHHACPYPTPAAARAGDTELEDLLGARRASWCKSHCSSALGQCAAAKVY